MTNEKDIIRNDAPAEKKRNDIEEMIEICKKLSPQSIERMRYMAEGAALIAEHHEQRAAV